MDITVEKIKGASYWCKKLWATNDYYRQNEELVKRFTSSEFKVWQVIIRFIPVLIITFIAILFFAIGRVADIYPIKPPEPQKVFLNEIIKPVFLSLTGIGILYFQIALLLGIKKVKKDLKNAVVRSNQLKQRIERVIKEKIEIIV